MVYVSFTQQFVVEKNKEMRWVYCTKGKEGKEGRRVERKEKREKQVEMKETYLCIITLTHNHLSIYQTNI
jgi:hypothetical protein